MIADGLGYGIEWLDQAKGLISEDQQVFCEEWWFKGPNGLGNGGCWPAWFTSVDWSWWDGET